MLASQLHAGLTRGFFPSGFPTKSCMHFYSLTYMLHPQQSHPLWYTRISNIWQVE